MNFESDFMPRLGGRANGFKILFDHLNERAAGPSALVLVETGCIRLNRGALPWLGAGCSSILFHSFAESTHARFISIDHNEQNCAVARQHCPNATILCGDSVKMLYSLRKDLKKIDLLYLDSYDLDWKDPHPSALHHFNELCAASPLLHPGSILFVDDNTSTAGKGMYIRHYMKSIGAKQICEDYQIGFIIP